MRHTSQIPSSGSRRPTGRRLLRLLAATILTVTAGVGLVASPASAAPRDGKCEAGEFCLYYNSNYSGSVFDMWDYDADLRNNVFLGTGAGKGQVVANNAASYWNRTPLTYRVYTSINYGGSTGWLSAGRYGNFSAGYKNNVESARIKY